MGKPTALKVKALTEPGSYIDGDGLILVVGAGGVGRWKLRATVAGKRRDIGVGSLRALSLGEVADLKDKIISQLNGQRSMTPSSRIWRSRRRARMRGYTLWLLSNG